MSTKLVDFDRAAADRAPKGATHWKLLALPANSHPDWKSFTDSPVLNGTLVFEWGAFDPRAVTHSEWTRLIEYPETVSQTTVFNSLVGDEE